MTNLFYNSAPMAIAEYAGNISTQEAERQLGAVALMEFDRSERSPDSLAAVDYCLQKNNRYPGDSAVHQFVQARVDLLSDGAIPAIVVHDNEPNAFATDDCVIVNDGLLKLLDYEEELDGILAHEQTHINRQHSEKRRREQGLASTIGQVRVGEIEADIGAFELMDRKGVNVAGLPSAFSKLEEFKDENKFSPKKEPWPLDDITINIGNVTHGSILDRRLNLEESLWVMDVRNVSRDDMTPLPFQEQDFQTFEKDFELAERYQELPTDEQVHFLVRQRNKEIPAMPAEELASKFQSFIEEEAPEVDSKTRRHIVELYSGSDTEVRDPDELINLAKVISQPILEKFNLGHISQKAAHAVESKLKEFLDNENLTMDAYAETVERLKSYMPNEDSSWEWRPIVNHLSSSEALARNRPLTKFAHYLAKTDARMLDIAEGLKVDDRLVLKRKNNFFAAIGRERIKLAMAIEDRAEFLRFVSKFGLRTRIAEQTEREFQLWGGGEDLYTQPDAASIRQKEEIAEKSEEEDEKIDPELEALRRDEKAFGLTNFMYAVRDQEFQESRAKSAEQRIYSNKVITRIRKIVKGASVTDLLKEAGAEMQAGRDTSYLKDLLVDFDEYSTYFGVNNELLLACASLSKDGFLSRIPTPTSANTRNILDLVKTTLSMPEQLEALGLKPNFEVTIEDLDDLNDFKQATLRTYLGAAISNPKVLEEYLANFPVSRVRLEGLFLEGDEYERIKHTWSQVAVGLMDKIGDKEPTNEQLIQLAALGLCADNVQINLQVPRDAFAQIVANLSFNESLALLDRFNHLPQYVFSAAIELLIEEKAQTVEEFEQLERFVHRQIEAMAAETKLAGRLALADGLLIENYKSMRTRERRIGVKHDTIEGLQSTKLLKAMLETARNDLGLKSYLFNRWFTRYRRDVATDSVVLNAFKIEDIIMFQNRPDRKARYFNWALHAPEHPRFTPLESLIRGTYLASGPSKYYALRKLLIGGEGSVLTDELGRASLKEAFLSTWMDFEGAPSGQQEVVAILSSLLKVGDAEELYQRLNPVLMDLILRPPANEVSWDSFSDRQARIQLKRMLKDDVIFPPTKYDVKMLALKLKSLIGGGLQSKASLPAEMRLLQLFETEDRSRQNDRYTPFSLGLTVGKRLGSVGVRMLQLAGQYFDISAEDKEQLSEVYDDMRGQTRIQAWRVLKREAEHSPAIADLLPQIKKIRPRIGGGSLMTVYEVVKKDGSREAVAIKNPNVEYHLSQTLKLLHKTLEDAQHDEPNNVTYRFLQALLADSEQWILDELHDADFETNDIRFRLQNDTSIGAFNKGRSKYGILVPQTHPTGTDWVRRDEFIDGKNLTSLKISDNAETNIPEGIISKADYQSAVSLLTRNYVYQLTTTGLAHSDIHWGNFRITNDNTQVAVFDRRNMLKLSDQDRALFKALIPAAAGGNFGKVKELAVDYLLGLQENEGLLNRERLRSDVLSGNGSSMLDTVMELKRRGIRVPLKFSLIVKNINGLNEMALQAGFSGLGEAFFATAEQSDLQIFNS